MANKKKGTVYRATGLPGIYSEDDTVRRLQTAIHENLSDDEKVSIQVSIAIVPSCYDHEREMVALVEFHERDPTFLSRLQDHSLESLQLFTEGEEITFDRHFHGFTQLYAPNPRTPVIADIVAITGLDGHAYGSWRGKGDPGPMWLRDFLSVDLPSCRTMIYGYNSKLSSFGIATLLDYGRELMEEIQKIRRGQECLKESAQSNEDSQFSKQDLYKATYGMLLFGVPHKGLIVDDIQKMLEGHENHPRADLLKQIESASDVLAFQLIDFKNLIQDRKVVSFYETNQSRELQYDAEKMRWVRTGRLMTSVVPDSALLQLPDNIEEKIPIHADHSRIVKFDSKFNQGYTSARNKLTQFLHDAPSFVTSRFNKPIVLKFDNIPSIATPKFFGRKNLIEEIENTLLGPRNQADRPKTIILQALGGQGKTQISLELCRRLKNRVRGLFWVDATSEATAERSFEEIAGELNDHPSRKFGDTKSKVKFVKQTIYGWEERWLMVFDSYDDLQSFDIRQFLPESGNGGIVISSRHESAKKFGKHFPVQSMNGDGGVELLLKDIPNNESDEIQALGRKIVDRLGGLALAIEQAAAYILFMQIPLNIFAEQYEKKKKEILEYIPDELWEYRRSRLQSEKSKTLCAFTTWEMSFQQIELEDKVRKDLVANFLGVISFLEPSHVGSYLFQAYQERPNPDQTLPWLSIFSTPGRSSATQLGNDVEKPTPVTKKRWKKRVKGKHRPTMTRLNQGPRKSERPKPPSVEQLSDDSSTELDERKNSWSEDQFWSVVSRLHQLSLIQSINRKPTPWISIHPVVRDWLQFRERSEIREEWLRQASYLLSSSLPLRRIEKIEPHTNRELVAHIQSCITSTERMKLQSGLGSASMRHETQQFGFYLEKHGKYDTSQHLFEALCSEDRLTLSHNDPILLQSLSDVAIAYDLQGRYKQAAELMEGVVKLRKEVLPEGHFDTLASMDNLSYFYMKQDQLDKAESLGVQAWENFTRFYGAEDRDTVRSMSTVAAIYQKQGRYDLAESLQTKVFNLYKRHFGADHASTLNMLGELATIYIKQGHWDKAESLENQIYDSCKQGLGVDSPTALEGLGSLAAIYRRQGYWDKAELLQSSVLEKTQQMRGEDHPKTLESKSRLAEICRSQGRLTQAEQLETKVLELFNETLGEDHSETLLSVRHLALIYREQGRLDEAEILYTRAIKGFRKVLGDEHPVTIHALAGRAKTYALQKRVKEAKCVQAELYDLSVKVLGERHPDTLEIMASLADSMFLHGNYFEATDLLKKCVETSQQVLRSGHPDRLAREERLRSMEIEVQGIVEEFSTPIELE